MKLEERLYNQRQTGQIKGSILKDSPLQQALEVDKSPSDQGRVGDEGWLQGLP